MAYNTAIAYSIILLLTPIPNAAIASYINAKPILTKVIINDISKNINNRLFACMQTMKYLFFLGRH